MSEFNVVKLVRNIGLSVLAGVTSTLMMTESTVRASNIERLVVSLCEPAKTDDLPTMRKNWSLIAIQTNKLL